MRPRIARHPLIPGAAALTFLIAVPAASRTWNIYADQSGDARTIQEAMEQAAFGDSDRFESSDLIPARLLFFP